MTINHLNLIHRQTWLDRSGQSIRMESFWRVGDLSLHIEITRNAYDHQSHATIQKMTATGWKHVASIPYPLMRSLVVNVFSNSANSTLDILEDYTRAAFSTDEKTLLDLAEAILL